ncbi:MULTISPECIES: pitrilysin family protein [Mesorhizobium]|nr:pitrilysin family protein [Mesorhizobium muleiense]
MTLGAQPHAAMNIQEVKSEKGMIAWLVEDHTVEIVNIGFAFNGGITQDPVGKEGMANLMAGLFIEGAGNYDSDAFQMKLDDAGAEMGLEAQRHYICGSVCMLPKQQDAAFGLLRLALNAPRFDQGPIDRVRAEIVSDIVGSERDPDAIAQRKWLRAIYGTHPFSRPGEGTKESLAGITPSDLLAFHKAIFARDGLHIAVVGDIDANTLRERLDQLFGDLPEQQTLAPVADVVPKLGQLVEENCDLPQTSLRLAWPGVKRSAPDHFATVLMNDILGGSGMTSRLFEEVREKRGLAYHVSSELTLDKLLVTTETRSDCAAQTLSIVRDVVKQMAQQGPTGAELKAAKKHLIGTYAIDRLGSTSSIADRLLDLQIHKADVDYNQRRARSIGRVTLKQVKAAAKKLLSAEPAILVVGRRWAARMSKETHLAFLLPWGFSWEERIWRPVGQADHADPRSRFAGLARHWRSRRASRRNGAPQHVCRLLQNTLARHQQAAGG